MSPRRPPIVPGAQAEPPPGVLGRRRMHKDRGCSERAQLGHCGACAECAPLAVERAADPQCRDFRSGCKQKWPRTLSLDPRADVMGPERARVRARGAHASVPGRGVTFKDGPADGRRTRHGQMPPNCRPFVTWTLAGPGVTRARTTTPCIFDGSTRRGAHLA